MKRPFLFSLLLALGSLAIGPTLADTVPPARTMVRLTTEAGPIDIELLDTEAPRTVANFLGYVSRGAYDGTFLHRLHLTDSLKVLQGGGLRFDESAVPRVSAVATVAPVANEFSATRSNLRATVAMARLGGRPDSATNQWFVNLVDNVVLDGIDGGFTVFGRVTPPSMAVVDALAKLGRIDASACTALLGAPAGAMGELPLAKPLAALSCDSIRSANLVGVPSARELPPRAATSDSDRIFNYLEAAYPQYVAPASAPTLSWEGYTYRYYARTNSYVGTSGGNVFYLVPALGPNITDMGGIADWLALAASAGY